MKDAERLLAAVKSGQTFEQAAASVGVMIAATDTFARSQPDPRLSPAPRAVGLAFGLPAGKTGGPVPGPAGVYVVRKDAFFPGDLAMYEAGMTAQDDGYDAVCIDTMSDSGVNALRSVLEIPVIGPGRASYLTALMLGSRFSVLTQWDPWKPIYARGIRDLGLQHLCASIRSINIPPDLRNLLGGKEEVVFAKLEEEGRRAIEDDGADVILIGSTTMHQSVEHLRRALGVPVINPGVLAIKLAELFVQLGLSHSKVAYMSPETLQDEKLHSLPSA